MATFENKFENVHGSEPEGKPEPESKRSSWMMEVPESEPEQGDFSRGLEAGIQETQALGGAAIGILGSGLKALSGGIVGEGMEAWGQETYKANMDEAAKYMPPKDAAKFLEIGSAGEFADWAQYNLGKLVPNMVTAVAGGGVGGVLAKQALSKGAKAVLSKGIKNKVDAELAKRAAKVVGRGQMAGLVGTSAGLESGSIYGDILSETGEAAPGTALAYGIPAGMLEAIVPGKVLGKLGVGKIATEEAGERAAKGVTARLKEGGKEALKQAPTEAATEVAQGVLERTAMEDYKDTPVEQALAKVFDAEQMIEEGAVGALGGSVFGGAAGMAEGVATQRMRDERAKVEAERMRRAEAQARVEQEAERRRAEVEAAQARERKLLADEVERQGLREESERRQREARILAARAERRQVRREAAERPETLYAGPPEGEGSKEVSPVFPELERPFDPVKEARARQAEARIAEQEKELPGAEGYRVRVGPVLEDIEGLDFTPDTVVEELDQEGAQRRVVGQAERGVARGLGYETPGAEGVTVRESGLPGRTIEAAPAPAPEVTPPDLAGRERLEVEVRRGEGQVPRLTQEQRLARAGRELEGAGEIRADQGPMPEQGAAPRGVPGAGRTGVQQAERATRPEAAQKGPEEVWASLTPKKRREWAKAAGTSVGDARAEKSSWAQLGARQKEKLEAWRQAEPEARTRTLTGDVEGITFASEAGAGAGAETEPGPVWRSRLTEAVEGVKQNKATPQQWAAMLGKTPGVKPEEIEATGLHDWMDAQKGRRVTKDEVQAFLEKGGIKLEETVRSADEAEVPRNEYGDPLVNEYGEVTEAGIYQYVAEQEERGDWEVEAMEDGEYAAIDQDGEVLSNAIGEPIPFGSAEEAWDFLRVQAEREARRMPNEELAEALGIDLGEAGETTKYGDWQMEGKKGGYRELLVTIPRPTLWEQRAQRLQDLEERLRADGLSEQEYRERQELIAGKEWGKGVQQFTSSHWNEPNILVHIRFNERMGAEGKRVLFVEEVQSDWHQEGRKKGYKQEASLDKLPADWDVRQGEKSDASGNRPWAVIWNDQMIGYGVTREEAVNQAVEWNDNSNQGVLDAPFKTSWPLLGMKRAIRWAAENGFDKVAWTPGEVQAERYDLSKQVSRVRYERNADENSEAEAGRLDVYDMGGDLVHSEPVAYPARVAELVGQEASSRLMDQKGILHGNNRIREISGEGLKMGGEGMKGFYDKILPSTMNKYLKKFGGRVKTTEVGETEVWSVELTPKLRTEALRGQAMFSEAKPAADRTPEDAENILRDVFGSKVWERMKSSGMVRVTDPEGMEKAGARATTQGLFFEDSGDVLINAQSGNLTGALLHEAGEHAGMEDMLLNSYGALQRQFDRMVRVKDEGALSAVKRVGKSLEHYEKSLGRKMEAGERKRLIQKERLAYFIEEAELRQGEKPTGLLGRVLTEMKAWFRQTGLGQSLAQAGVGFELTDQMALALAKQAAKTALGIREERQQVAKELGVEEKAEGAGMASGYADQPFSYQGNKSWLAADEEAKTAIAALSSNRVIDAFGGSGVFSKIVSDAIGAEERVVNERNPFIHKLHKALGSNIEGLIADVQNMEQSFVGKTPEDITVQLLQGMDEMDPAAIYIAQNNTFSNRLLEPEKNNKSNVLGGIKRAVDRGRFGKGLDSTRLARVSPQSYKATKRDAWQVAQKATAGDVVLLDPGYWDSGSATRMGGAQEVSIENQLEQLKKLKPAMDRGAEFVYTNHWNTELEQGLSEMGWGVQRLDRKNWHLRPASTPSSGTEELFAVWAPREAGMASEAPVTSQEEMEGTTSADVMREKQEGRGTASLTSEAQTLAPEQLSDFADRNAKIRREKKPLMDKVRDVVARQVKPGGLFTKYAPGAFQEKLRRDANLVTWDRTAERWIKTLEDVVEKSFGKKWKDLSEEEMVQLDGALRGDGLELLPEEVQAPVQAMRNYIDGFSKEYAQILQEERFRLEAEITDPETGDARRKNLGETLQTRLALLRTIGANVGRYVHRSYKVFDDGEWYRNVPDDTLNRARVFLMEEQGLTADEADKRMNDILRDQTAFNSLEQWIKQTPLGRKDLSVLMKRNEGIPDPILELMGAYIDPRMNYAKTAAKLTRLVSNHRFLQRLVEIGKDQGWLFDAGDLSAPLDADWTIKGGEGYEPLRGFKTFPEVEQALKDAVDSMRWPDWLESVVRVASAVKYSKTIASPLPTGLRNYVSALMGLVANADFNWKGLVEASGAWREYLFNEDLGVQHQRLQHLGILGVSLDTPFAGELMELRKDIKLDDKIYIQEEKPQGLSGMAQYLPRVMFRATHDARKLAERGYQFGDDLVKIAAFKSLEKNLDKYIGERMKGEYEGKFPPGSDSVDNDTIGKVALKRTEKGTWAFVDAYGNNVTEEKQTWATREAAAAESGEVVGKWHVQREAAERIRNTYMTYSLVGRLPRFIRKFPLAGTFVSFPVEVIRTVAGMVHYLKKDLADPDLRPMGIKRLMGMGATAASAHVAVMLGQAATGTSDEELEAARKVAPEWNRLSNLVPAGRDENGNLELVDFGYVDLYSLWRKLPNALLNGDPLEEDMKNVAKDLLMPFFGMDISAQAVYEVLVNDKLDGGQVFGRAAPATEQGADIMKHLFKAAAPSTLLQFEKIAKASDGHTTRSGEKLETGSEVAALFGWKTVKTDPSRALWYGNFEFGQRRKDATYYLSQTISDPNKKGEAELRAAYERAQGQRADAYQVLIGKVDAARELGMTEFQLRQELKKLKVAKQDIPWVMRGEVPSWAPDSRRFISAQDKASVLYSEGEQKEIRDRRRQVIRWMAEDKAG